MDACSRPYSSSRDPDRLRLWLVEVRRCHGHGCWHVGDLVWRLFLHSLRYDLARTVRLWEDREGSLLGFAIVTPPAQTATVYFDLQVAPSLRGQGLEEQMLDWVEGWQPVPRGEVVGDPPLRFATDTGVYEDDAGQIRALERRGYLDAAGRSLLLYRPLADPIPWPVLPPGFALRAVAGPPEAEERVAAHRDAFSPSRVTAESYLRLMRTPGYVPELDLVAVGRDGSFGAFCTGWLDEVNRVGEFEPVGTRAALRRRGLARAVLCEGLDRMKAGGMVGAIVGPIPVANRAALGLYRSLGFSPMCETYNLIRDPQPRTSSA